MRDRMLRLYELKSASRQEVEKAETDVRSANTDLADAQISVQKEAAHLTYILHLPTSSLQSINETTEQIPVIAPTSGIVVSRMITLGSVVEPGEEVYTLTDLGSVWMMASVNESDIGRIHVGQKARILTQPFPDQAFAGRDHALGNGARCQDPHLAGAHPRAQPRAEIAPGDVRECANRAGRVAPGTLRP